MKKIFSNSHSCLKNRRLPCTSLETQVCLLSPRLNHCQGIFTSLTLLPPLGPISYLWSTSLAPFSVCASSFLGATGERQGIDRAVTNPIQISVSKLYSSSICLLVTFLFSSQRFSSSVAFGIFFFNYTPQKEIHFMSWPRIFTSINCNKILWNKVYPYKMYYILIFSVVFYFIFEYTNCNPLKWLYDPIMNHDPLMDHIILFGKVLASWLWHVRSVNDSY